MSDLNKLKEPERSRHNWNEGAMRECLCGQWAMTVLIDSEPTCPSCCDESHLQDWKNFSQELIDRLEAAEAELARRDASAGEPVAVVGSDFSLFWAGSGPIAPLIQRHNIKVGAKLYTAAQPSAVPPEMTLENAKGLTVFGKDNWCKAYNQAIADAKALGCKAEKVVVLPREVSHVTNKWFEEGRDAVLELLDATGIKWREE